MNIKQRLRQFLARQIGFGLAQEPEILRASLHALLAESNGQLSMSMGIPVPLGNPLPPTVHPPNVDAFILDFIRQHRPTILPNAKSLDIGCGDQPRTHFDACEVHGCDIRASDIGNVTVANLFVDPIPFTSASFQYVTAYDFIEHIPRVLATQDDRTRFPFIELMDEIHRVLKPQGLFLSKTPAFPSKEVFQDPTHVNIITEATFPFYFCSEPDREPYARVYGFEGAFTLVDQVWCHSNLLTLMERR